MSAKESEQDTNSIIALRYLAILAGIGLAVIILYGFEQAKLPDSS